MNFSLFGYGVTLSGHYYRRGRWHQCEFKDCPSRLPPAEVKYVVVSRATGAYSERFDTQEDAKRALNLLQPGALILRHYDILESVKLSSDPEQWIIGDPEIPESAGITFINYSKIGML